YTASQTDQVTNDVVMVGTAADVMNPAAGLRWGPPVALSLAPLHPYSSFLGLAAGDFDGNGQLEIALVATSFEGVPTLNVYTIAPRTLALSLASAIAINQFFAAPGNHASLAAGRFGAASHDQLVLVAAPLLDNFHVLPIDFKGLQPVLSSHVLSPGFG